MRVPLLGMLLHIGVWQNSKEHKNPKGGVSFWHTLVFFQKPRPNRKAWFWWCFLPLICKDIISCFLLIFPECNKNGSIDLIRGGCCKVMNDI